jgi:TRAP-type mannitol/chloroaromatic compound transport system substrate-binding protein
MINLKAFNSLPDHLKMIIETACYRMNLWVISEFEAKNNEYLEKIKNESGVEVRQFSPEILQELKKHTREVLKEIADNDPMAAKVYESFSQFAESIRNWALYSEKLYHNM